MKISHKDTGAVIYDSAHINIKKCVEEAVKSGAYLRGANLEDAILNGADLEGSENLFRIGPSIDSHEFFAVRHDIESGAMIKAGCRWFTVAQAHEHWGGDTRPDIGDQRRRYLKFIEEEVKALGWNKGEKND